MRILTTEASSSLQKANRNLFRAYYRNSVADVRSSSPSEVAFTLVEQNGKFGFTELKADAVDAWKDEVSFCADATLSTFSKVAEVAHWGILLRIHNSPPAKTD